MPWYFCIDRTGIPMSLRPALFSLSPPRACQVSYTVSELYEATIIILAESQNVYFGFRVQSQVREGHARH